METDRIHELIVYGTVLWPRTFTAPTDDVTLALTVQVWQDVLGDLDPAQVRAAMAAWPGRFPPTPRELRDATLAVARAAGRRNSRLMRLSLQQPRPGL